MKQARIYLDMLQGGKRQRVAYQGEDMDRLEERRPGLASGFSSHNLGALNALKFGDEPLVVRAEINIRGHFERILTRIRNGTLDAQRIVIELQDYMP